MLKRVGDTETICTAFAPLFRDITRVRTTIGRKEYDIILSTLLYEHKDRGKFGYLLTGQFFEWFEKRFSMPPYEALGPRGAGADIEFQTVFPAFPHRCPWDIVVQEDKRSGIESDPNRANDEEYIVRLVGQMMWASLGTVKLVTGLPKEWLTDSPLEKTRGCGYNYGMNKTRTTQELLRAKSRRPNGLISQAAIRRLARQIAERFQPDQIILFGSYAHGQPDPESDVDLLVIMPASNEINQAVRIRLAVDHPFPLDLLVRTPENLRWRLEEGDWFLREVVGKGKVLYEKADRRVGAQGRGRSQSSSKNGRGKAAAQ
jgi:predicted nucleotidyltransferase